MSNTSSKETYSINSDVDAVIEGINRVGILDSEVQICANCGKEGTDVTNTCNKCKMVMYCNAACKKRHRHKHKKDCEEHLKRVAENAAKEHDEKLFKQPPPLEDCPICMIRLPTLATGLTYMTCCGKMICSGCIYAVHSRAVRKSKSKPCPLCSFCRVPNPTTDEELIKRIEKRVEMNDPKAMQELGYFYATRQYGLHQSYAKALELWHRAGELGNAGAYFDISNAYRNGRGVEVDDKKAVYYAELAAMGGDATARYNLGIEEAEAGNMDRALRHWMIAARDGESDSLTNIKYLCFDGLVTRDYYAKTLRSYQVYLDEIRSDQRDKAAASDNRYKYYETPIEFDMP